MIDYKVYCPSWRRAHVCTTHKLFKPETFCYVVREEEAGLYEKLGTMVEKIPAGAVDSISTTRNWILENATSDYVIMVDDDYRAIRKLHNRKLEVPSPDELHAHIINGFQMAIDAEAGLWGINVNGDPKQYSVIRPFQFRSSVLGPFLGIVDTDIRYDTRFGFKEDFDYFLQHMKKHGKVLRFDFLHYDVDHQKLEGGLNVTRTMEKERAEFLLLKEKWGSLVRENRQTKNASINPIVRF